MTGRSRSRVLVALLALAPAAGLGAPAALAGSTPGAAHVHTARTHPARAHPARAHPARTHAARTHAARAHAARALKASDSAHLRYTAASGSMLYETGSASGTLPGSMRAHVSIGATIAGSFTIYTRGGTIAGHGAATPKGVGTYESFAGSLTVTGGSGRYAHAHGRARLYGTFDRNNYALVVQTVGTLYY